MSAGPAMLLTKGIEEEVYTGTPEADFVGLSERVSAAMPDYHCEPDHRNSEYATEPHRRYADLGCDLLDRRRRLRDFIGTLGPYTLIPGASLSLGDTETFHRSRPDDPYHTFIEKAYGTRVVTASIHISVGLDDPDALLRAWRVVRAEAALFLALSATSPFLGGRSTGWQSTRWRMFPRTPHPAPFFASPAAYAEWMEACLADGRMQNRRHLWLAARPNGPLPPHEINRLELRVCDRMDDPCLMLAATALLEARVQGVLADPNLDPLRVQSAEWLREYGDRNEQSAARDGLAARVVRWSDGRELSVRDWLVEYVAQAESVARPLGFACYLRAIRDVLRDGNVATQWQRRHEAGESIRDILRGAIVEMEQRERRMRECGCLMAAAPAG